MQYMNQKHSKDCLQATLSNLLGVDYNTIPKFYERYNEDIKVFTKEYDDYLNDNGYFRLFADVSYKHSCVFMPFYCSKKQIRCLGILKKNGRERSHTVLLQLTNTRNKAHFNILHDPLHNTDYCIEDLIQVEFIFEK